MWIKPLNYRLEQRQQTVSKSLSNWDGSRNKQTGFLFYPSSRSSFISMLYLIAKVVKMLHIQLLLRNHSFWEVQTNVLCRVYLKIGIINHHWWQEVCFFLFWVEAVNLLNNAIGRTRLKKVTFLLLFCKMVTVVTSPVLCTQLKPVDCIPPSSSRDSDYRMCVTCQRWTSIRCTKPALQKLI